MAALEGLVLDGLDLNDVTTLRLQGFDCPPPAKRQEWAQGADIDGALLVRDPLFDNREITARLRISKQTTMDLALTQLASLSKKLEEAEQQPDGLALVWTPSGSTKSVTFYVLSGTVEGLPITLTGDDAGWFLRSPVITVKLVCKPFGYGTPVTSSTASSATPFVTATIASVGGDVPAEGRLLATDAATQNRRYIEWGLEQRYYDAATSLLVDSDDMVVTGYSGFQTTRTGAYDPNASGNSVVRGTLFAQPTAVCSTAGTLTHVGQFRVKARIWASAAGEYVRFAWAEGDGPFRTNPYASPIAVAGFSEVDFGVVNIPPKQLGTQRWQGRVEAYTTGTAGTDTVDVDYLVLVPAGEGYGKIRAADITQVGTFVGSDDFESLGAGSNLNARAALGATWATSGVATDFTGTASGISGAGVTRATTSEATPRFAVLGSNLTDTEVKASVFTPLISGTFGGVLARWVDANNYLVAYCNPATITRRVSLVKSVAGVQTVLATGNLPSSAATVDLRLNVYADGTAALAVSLNGSVIWSVSTSADTVLATAGALASGKAGLFDQKTGVSPSTRIYDNVSIQVPRPAPVALYSGRVAEIRHDGAIRQDSTGTYYGPVPAYRGSRFLVPPAGDESRTSRILVKAHRNDIEASSSDTVTDNLTIQTIVTPRYVVVPF